MKSSEQHRAGNCGPLVSDINTRAVSGSLHAGKANTHLNHLLSTMNIPTMNHCLFTRRERELSWQCCGDCCKGKLWNELEFRKKTFLSNYLVHGQMAYLESLFLTIWDGRKGEGDTTLQLVMGLTTRKVVSYSTRCKTCRVCSHNNLTGKEKKDDCR